MQQIPEIDGQEPRDRSRRGDKSFTARVGAPRASWLWLVHTEVILQARAGFYAAYAVMTVVFFVVLTLLPTAWRETGFELLVLLDPTFMGFFFAGGLVLLELDQGVLPVVLTRGHGFTHYWRAKVAALLLLAVTVVAALTGAAWSVGFVRPQTAGLARLAVGVILNVPLFFGIGLIVTALVPRLVDYFVFSGLVLLPVMYPLLELAGVAVGLFGLLSPLGGGVILISSVFEPRYTGSELLAAAAGLLVWNAIVYHLAARAFERLSSGETGLRLLRGPKHGRSRGSALPNHHDGAPRARHRWRLIPSGWADVRLLLREPVGPLILSAPILAAVVIGRGIPWLLAPDGPASPIITSSTAAVILSYMDHARSFVLLLGSTVYGMLGAFSILDEKDQGLLPFLYTLPGRPGWFLLRRCSVLLLFHAAAVVIATIAGDLVHGPPGVFVLSLAVDALVLPLVFLTLAIVAENKIQGLAMAKVINLVTVPPLLLIALPGRWGGLTGVLPTAWGSLLRLHASGPAQVAVTTAVGMLYAVLILTALYGRARRIG